MDNNLRISEAIASALQELLAHVIGITTSCTILKDKIPSDIEPAICTISESGEELKREVEKVYHNVEKQFNIASPSNTVLQIRRLVVQWKKQEEILSIAVHQIHDLKKSGFRLSDPQLDAVLSENLTNAFIKLDQMLNILALVDEKDLISWTPLGDDEVDKKI